MNNRLYILIALTLSIFGVALTVNGDCLGKFQFTLDDEQVCITQEEKDDITTTFINFLQEDIPPIKTVDLQVAIAESDPAYVQSLETVLRQKLATNKNQPIFEPLHKVVMSKDPAYFSFVETYFDNRTPTMNDLRLYGDYMAKKIADTVIDGPTDIINSLQ